MKFCFAVAPSTVSVAEPGEGAQGPGIKWAGSFQNNPNNMGIWTVILSRYITSVGFLFLVYKMRIIICGCIYSVSSKTTCPCIFPFICSFYSFVSRLLYARSAH